MAEDNLFTIPLSFAKRSSFITLQSNFLIPDKRDILRLSDTLSCGDCPGVQCAGLMAVRRIKDYEFMMNHMEELDRVEEQDTG